MPEEVAEPGKLKQTKNAGALGIAQVLLEKASFSHREDYLSLPQGTKNELGPLTFTVGFGESNAGERGVVRVGIATDPALKPLYNFEIVVVGLLERVEGGVTLQAFHSSGSSIALVYPFVRETLANITQRGRFGPIWLNAINTHEIAAQAMAQPKAKKAGSAAKRPAAATKRSSTRKRSS